VSPERTLGQVESALAAAATEAERSPTARVVEANERYVIVAKFGDRRNQT
jgi:hypothetical protein